MDRIEDSYFKFYALSFSDMIVLPFITSKEN